MKKIFRIIGSLFVCLTSISSLCSCSCEHDFCFVENTATCEKDGTISYKCSKCGEIKTETAYATGHSWNKTKTTATCTKSGQNYFECKKCHNTKTETQEALGHSYRYNDVCSECKEYKYQIKWSQTEKYAGQVLYCTFSSSGLYVTAKIGIAMSKSGKNVWFSWFLRDSDGNKIGNGMPYFSWTSAVFDYTLTVCYISSLNENSTYNLEIANIGVLN